jgi:cob(I)alamin adenosyltransferase
MTLYTRQGDKGSSRLAQQKKPISKAAGIFDVLGTTDELSSTLGFLHLSKLSEVRKLVLALQEDLFTLGSILAGKPMTTQLKLYWEIRTTDFEKIITNLNEKMSPLSNFILPGGCIESCYLHMARVVCRRLERVFVKYSTENNRRDLGSIEPYLNRLSDLLFCLARYANKTRKFKDIVWSSSKKI